MFKLFKKTPKVYKEIIDGYLYDTSKSEYITYFYTDSLFDRYKAYRTENDRYFIIDLGHVHPISEDDLKRSLAKYDVDEYIRIFGKVKDA